MNKQNILLITSDQQHWCTLGVANPAIKTPNLDRLACRGMRFTRAYCPNPTCTPTRASIITGMYPSQHGAWSLGTKLPETVPTLGGYLKPAGYHSALIGKAHFQQLLNTAEYPSIESNPLQQDLDFWRSFNGPFYGFDYVELARNHTDEAHVGQHYALWLEEKGYDDWRQYYSAPAGTRAAGEPYMSTENSRSGGKWEMPERYHYNNWIVERSQAVLERSVAIDEPFFLWASFPDPHPPYLVPEPWASMYDPDAIIVPPLVENEHAGNPRHFQLTQRGNPDFSDWQEEEGNAMHGFCSHRLRDRDRSLARDMAIYYGMISFMDHAIGQILDRLDALGLTDSTLVVFTTDHGHFHGQHGLIAKGPFHYEDMVRIPFIVSQPGRIPAGQTTKAMLSLVDLAPTFLDFAALPIPRSMTGRSQKHVWEGTAPGARDHVIVENHHQPTTIHARTYVDERYKLTVYYKRDDGEIFDLQEDPGELNNLWNSAAHQELKCSLFKKLIDAELGKEPMWMPRVWGA